MTFRYISAGLLLLIYLFVWLGSQPKSLTADDGVQQVRTVNHSVVQYNALDKIFDFGWVVVGGIAVCLCIPGLGKNKI